jgi:hypothetical protein
MTDIKDQELQALRERAKELERQIAAHEREIAIEEAKLSPRQRALVDARLAERKPIKPLH